MPSLYSCKAEIHPSGDSFRITKFTSDFDVESSYSCTLTTCECPAGHRPLCRHREMLPKFINRGFVNANMFFDYDRGGWVSGPAEFVNEASMVEHPLEALAESLPEGITMITLNGPESIIDVHNAIAEATDESTLSRPSSVFLRRRV